MEIGVFYSWSLSLVLIALTGWIVGEIKDWKIIRRVCAAVALMGAYFIAVIAGWFTQFNYNSDCGRTSLSLLDALAESMPADSKQQKALREAGKKIRPTYESRAHYNKVVQEIINDLKSGE